MAGDLELIEALKCLRRRMRGHLRKQKHDNLRELEDLEQETVCRVLQTTRLKAMSRSQTEGVLWVTFKNLVMDWSRKKETQQKNEESEWPGINESVRKMIGWNGLDLRHFYKEVVKLLPPRGQAIIDMTFRERFSDSEIAKALGIREDNVRSQRRFWLRRIREELERESRQIKKGLPLHNLKLLKKPREKE
jgi:RNA polymerase sigma factor (sigma-70 family)